jgi:hypothetical protein
MGKFYKIYMVLLDNIFTQMQTGITKQHARHHALLSFMGRPTSPQSTETLPEAIDNLSKPSTGYQSGLFVPQQSIGTFLKPPQPVQPVEKPVVQETQFDAIKNVLLHLIKKKTSVYTFCKGFESLSIPHFVVAIILMKFGFLIDDKNGEQMVNMADVRNNMLRIVKTIYTVMMKVDLMDSLFETLRDGKTLHWSSFMNKTHGSYVKSGLSKTENTEVLQLLRVLGVNQSTNILSLPSQWAFLSENDCRIMLWNLVSQEITTTPHAKAKKCGRTDASQSEVATTSHAKAKKRDRNYVEESPRNQDNRRKLSDYDLLRIFFTHLSEYLLQRCGFAVSLTEVIDNAFLALSSNDLRQLKDFLLSRDTIWILQRIMMDILPLTLLFPEEDCFLLVRDGFSALSLNMTEIMDKYHLFSMEAIVLFDDASQRIHEESVREEQERERCRILNEAFIRLLRELWKTKNFEAFLVGLRQVCLEFDSRHTNRSRLEIVVSEFMRVIYNATTRACHNGEQCHYPLQDFLEYCIKRGVFRMRRVRP